MAENCIVEAHLTSHGDPPLVPVTMRWLLPICHTALVGTPVGTRWGARASRRRPGHQAHDSVSLAAFDGGNRMYSTANTAGGTS